MQLIGCISLACHRFVRGVFCHWSLVFAALPWLKNEFPNDNPAAVVTDPRGDRKRYARRPGAHFRGHGIAAVDLCFLYTQMHTGLLMRLQSCKTLRCSDRRSSRLRVCVHNYVNLTAGFKHY